MKQPELNEVKCPKCENNQWIEVISLAAVPAVLSKNGQGGFTPIGGSHICAHCGVLVTETEQFKEMYGDNTPAIIT